MVLKRVVVSASLRGSLLTVFDQAVCSLSNFITGIIIARSLLPEVFGVYTLYFTGILLLAGFQNALITGPMRVLGVRTSGGDASGYFRAQLWLQLLLSTILVSGAAIGLFVFYPTDIFETFAFLLCILFVQFQELARIINLTRMTFSALLKLDVITHGLRIGLLLAAMSLNILSAGTALLIIAVACGVALIVAGRSAYPAAATALLGTTALENWRYGRWLLLETISFSASTHIYLYLVALWVDNAAVGGLSAVLVLMNVLNVLLLGVMNYAIPEARRRLIENGYISWRTWLWQIGLLFATSAAAFGIFFSIYGESLLTIIYSPSYGKFASLIPIIAIRLFFTACNTVLSAAFRTAELPQVGFAAKATSAVAMVLIAYPLLKGWGVTGATIGLLITQVLWTAVYIRYIATGILRQQASIVSNARPHGPSL